MANSIKLELLDKIIKRGDGANKYRRLSPEKNNERKNKMKERLDEKLKTFVQEFSLLQEEKTIYKFDEAKTNTKTLFDHDLKNGDKIMIQSHPMFEKQNYSFKTSKTAHDSVNYPQLKIYLSSEEAELFGEIFGEIFGEYYIFNH